VEVSAGSEWTPLLSEAPVPELVPVESVLEEASVSMEPVDMPSVEPQRLELVPVEDFLPFLFFFFAVFDVVVVSLVEAEGLEAESIVVPLVPAVPAALSVPVPVAAASVSVVPVAGSPELVPTELLSEVPDPELVPVESVLEDVPLMEPVSEPLEVVVDG
jgi:hypothetical protein